MMMKVWNQSSVKSILQLTGGEIRTGPFGTALKANEYSLYGTPVIAVRDIREGYVTIDEKTPKVPKEVVDRLSVYRLLEGDILFSRKGAVERIAIIKASQSGWLMGSDCIRLRFSELVNAKFVAYALQSPNYRSWIKQHSTGSTMASLSQGIIERIPLQLPPLPEQRAIAAILGALDDKIELNHQMNRTLEAMAQALFKSWFVDFDPVRAKAEGRVTGLPDEVAALFPDRLVESELGKIPEGWEAKSLLDVADLLSGGTPKTDVADYWNGGISWISAKDVGNAQGLFILETEKTISQLGLENSSSKLLPALTTVITARGTVGAYCLLARPMTMNQTNYGLKAKSEIGDYFIYFLLTNLVEHLRKQAYGTIFDTITTKTFRDTNIVLPPVQALEAFHQFVEPYMNKLLGQMTQSLTLAALRDTLLPKLISGEVRIHSADTPIK